jgi:hypothetical protein
MVAKTTDIPLATSAQDVERKLMELKHALELRCCNIGTPYKPDAWQHLLTQTGVIKFFPDIPEGLRTGFNAGIPEIPYTYTPPNRPSIIEYHEAFQKIMRAELDKGRYIGTLSLTEVETLVGPFRTSPLSIVPKPGRPGKFRLIQNFSYPHSPRDGITSVNSHIDSSDFPCTWGTFAVICAVAWKLPPGSEGAVRDVKEAYRTIPLAPRQWPGTVVRLNGEDRFAIDLYDAFGLASGGGVYGRLADAGVQIMRAKGMGPISKWVDDHVFFRILRTHMARYNQLRKQSAAAVASNGGKIHDGGRIWYKGRIVQMHRNETGKLIGQAGASMPDDTPEEFDEDMATPIWDLSDTSTRSEQDMRFTYCLDDVDRISEELGIPWEREKDINFSSTVPFIGFEWDLQNKTVEIPQSKKDKYRNAITTWKAKATHDLEETQKL